MAFCNITVTDAINGIDNIPAIQLSVYPNPVKDELFIKLDLLINKVEILGLSSRKVETRNCTSLQRASLQDNTEKINVSDLPSGVYLLKVHTDKGVVINKVVKK